jgi:hypothetical protein
VKVLKLTTFLAPKLVLLFVHRGVAIRGVENLTIQFQRN